MLNLNRRMFLSTLGAVRGRLLNYEPLDIAAVVTLAIAAVASKEIP